MFKKKLRAFQEKQLSAHLMMEGYNLNAAQQTSEQSAKEPQKSPPKEKCTTNFNTSLAYTGSS